MKTEILICSEISKYNKMNEYRVPGVPKFMNLEIWRFLLFMIIKNVILSDPNEAE